jgi:hypothetical protein
MFTCYFVLIVPFIGFCRSSFEVIYQWLYINIVLIHSQARSSQKIIYSGKLLDDHFVLKDVLQEVI